MAGIGDWVTRVEDSPIKVIDLVTWIGDSVTHVDDSRTKVVDPLMQVDD
ncbi:MAG: hypothetical protein SOI64_03800 [Bifidobacterium mongoliense]|nr:hypothetical protein [Bifidobacterium mongoliense]MDN6553602.1 hypothetical protein [Bifidobacterium mongoliense]MDN6782974.1 hypothetical protein [Bifidobacterium mongoliense]